jgi:sugar lactone lactonase YvrE
MDGVYTDALCALRRILVRPRFIANEEVERVEDFTGANGVAWSKSDTAFMVVSADFKAAARPSSIVGR